MFTYFFLYPLPILMVAYGLNTDGAAAKMIALIGAFAWYACLGFDGTCVALLVLAIWWVLIRMLKLFFS